MQKEKKMFFLFNDRASVCVVCFCGPGMNLSGVYPANAHRHLEKAPETAVTLTRTKPVQIMHG